MGKKYYPVKSMATCGASRCVLTPVQTQLVRRALERERVLLISGTAVQTAKTVVALGVATLASDPASRRWAFAIPADVEIEEICWAMADMNAFDAVLDSKPRKHRPLRLERAGFVTRATPTPLVPHDWRVTPLGYEARYGELRLSPHQWAMLNACMKAPDGAIAFPERATAVRAAVSFDRTFAWLKQKRFVTPHDGLSLRITPRGAQFYTLFHNSPHHRLRHTPESTTTAQRAMRGRR